MLENLSLVMILKGVIKLNVYRVYRKDINELPGYWHEIGYREVYCVAENPNQAKGIALAKHRSLMDNIAKRDVLVEEIKLEIGMILGAD